GRPGSKGLDGRKTRGKTLTCPSPKRRRTPLRGEPDFAGITAHAGLRLSAQSRVDGSTVGLRWIAVGTENGSRRGVQISGSAGRLRCSTDVSMVEATDFAKRHDPAGRWPFDRPPVGRVLVEREMRSCAVIVREVRGQDATQVAFAQNDDMIEALT